MSIGLFSHPTRKFNSGFSQPQFILIIAGTHETGHIGSSIIFRSKIHIVVATRTVTKNYNQYKQFQSDPFSTLHKEVITDLKNHITVNELSNQTVILTTRTVLATSVRQNELANGHGGILIQKRKHIHHVITLGFHHKLS
jgi:hypothetical protein